MIPVTIDARYAAVTVADSNGSTVFRAETPYRISFSFHNGMDGNAGEAHIRVFGVSDSDAYAVVNKGAAVALTAGNEISRGLVFSGDLIEANYIQADQKSYLELSSVDGDRFFSSYIKRAIGGGESLGGLVEKVVKGCSSPVDIGLISAAAYMTSLPRGIAAMCSPIDVIKSVARTLNAAYYVYQGRFYLLCANDAVTSPLTLDYDGGIIGVPTFDTYYAFFRHDIVSGIVVGQFVTFPSHYGVYRIAAIDGSGDTLEGPWALHITAIAQDGSTPKMTAVTSNIWR